MDVKNRSWGVNTRKPFGLRSNYVQITFNYVQLRSTCAIYIVKSTQKLIFFFDFLKATRNFKKKRFLPETNEKTGVLRYFLIQFVQSSWFDPWSWLIFAGPMRKCMVIVAKWAVQGVGYVISPWMCIAWCAQSLMSHNWFDFIYNFSHLKRGSCVWKGKNVGWFPKLYALQSLELRDPWTRGGGSCSDGWSSTSTITVGPGWDQGSRLDPIDHT